MLDQTLLMQTLQDIANTGERLSNPSEENAFIVIAEAFKNVGAEVNIERVPLFVSTVDNVRMTADGQRIKALGNAMTLPLDGNNPRQGTVSVQGHLRILSASDWQSYEKKGNSDEIVLLNGLANLNDLRKAQALGLKAVLFDTGDRIHRMIVSDVWGSPTPGCESRYVTMPNASIKHSDALTLKDGMRITLELAINSRWTTSPVLMAHVRHNEQNSEAFTAIVTGHIDSWGDGALDNASGIAAMVASAKKILTLKNRKHDVCYVIWSGHSHGRYAGSTAWHDKHFNWLNEKVFLNLNCDCLGAVGSTILGKTPVMASTAALARKAHEGISYTEAFTRFNRSCDQSFMSMGIPSVFSNISEVPPSGSVSMKVAGLSGVYGPYWHTTDDTMQGIDPQALMRDTEIFTNGLIQSVIEGPDALDLMAEWNEFSTTIREKLNVVKEKQSTDSISEAFVNEPIWQELLDKLSEMNIVIQKRAVEANSQVKVQTLKHIVAMAYSASALGLQDRAGQKARSLLVEAFEKWTKAKEESFEYFSAWTAMVRGANQLFAQLKSIERL